MVNIVTEKLNAAWKDFKSRNPQFNGRIALVGHSLGGVISYDIIANQPRDAPLSNSSSSESAFSDIKFPLLDFKPNFLFSMGSPMAAVMVMRGQEVEEYQLPKWCRYINVFHLFDPLGYRCEPLFDPSFASIPPMAIQR